MATLLQKLCLLRAVSHAHAIKIPYLIVINSSRSLRVCCKLETTKINFTVIYKLHITYNTNKGAIFTVCLGKCLDASKQ